MRGWDSISWRAVSQHLLALQTHPEIHFGLNLRACSRQGCSALVPVVLSVPQGPAVLPGGPGAAPFAGEMCAELIARACWQPEPPGVSPALTPLYILKFPHSLPASPTCTQRSPGLLKGFVHHKVLVSYPAQAPTGANISEASRGVSQTHYKSKWVSMWPRCCSFCPSAMLILFRFFFFLLPGKDCMEFMTRDSERHENQLEMDSLEITNKLLHFDLNNFC